VSCRKSCKKWRHGLFKSLQILFGVERNSVELREGYIPFSRGASILPSELENNLLEYCIIMDQRYYGLRPQDIKRMAFHLAIRNILKHPFNQEKSEAGKKWLRSF